MKEKVYIPIIMGDGIGKDIWHASKEVLEEAVCKAYGSDRTIEWIELTLGLPALERKGELVPREAQETIERYGFALKGPLTTPVGSGFRSVNVYLRQVFDLFINQRPVRYFPGLPSPLKDPDGIDLIVFRENTEDLYKGIEWQAGTEGQDRLRGFLNREMGIDLPADSGIGIKPMTRRGTKRFVRWVVEFALREKRRRITVVHKGNIMKYTEGAFREWAYEVAREYGGAIRFDGEGDGVLFDDVIADNMFMQVILRPKEYDVLLCPNLNGDYLSDACSALVGGLGTIPSANIGERVAIFEPVHGSAPKYEGKDVANPTAFLLSGTMLFRHLGLVQAADTLESAIRQTIGEGIVTQDLGRLLGVKPVRCSEFAREVTKRLGV
jgi:isocitrate dehydrogenase